MRGYLNLVILGYLPWLLVEQLKDYFSLIVAVLAPLIIVMPFIFRAIKQQNFISLLFISGFIVYAINLCYPLTIFTIYFKNILLIVGLTAMFSVILEKPFTIIYAKETVSPDKWNHPIFIKINTIISLVWSAVFICEYLFKLLNLPYYIVLNTLLIIFAAVFSNKYPDYYKNRILSK